MALTKITKSKRFTKLPRAFTGEGASSKEAQEQAFFDGVQAFREGSLPKNSVEPVWVKKWIDKDAWNKHYKDVGTYCVLWNLKEVVSGSASARLKKFLQNANSLPMRMRARLICSDELIISLPIH